MFYFNAFLWSIVLVLALSYKDSEKVDRYYKTRGYPYRTASYFY